MHNAPQNTNDRGLYWSAIFIVGMLLTLVAFILVSQTPAHGSTGTITEAGSTDIQITSTPAACDSTRMAELFAAIQQIETGGEDNPSEAVGDNGASIGPYQIQKPYYTDAIWQMNRDDVDTSDMRYNMVRQSDFAEEVVLAYWKRYNSRDLAVVTSTDSTRAQFIDAAVRLGRIHNGGPRGHTRESTADYGRDLRTLLTE